MTLDKSMIESVVYSSVELFQRVGLCSLDEAVKEPVRFFGGC